MMPKAINTSAKVKPFFSRKFLRRKVPPDLILTPQLKLDAPPPKSLLLVVFAYVYILSFIHTILNFIFYYKLTFSFFNPHFTLIFNFVNFSSQEMNKFIHCRQIICLNLYPFVFLRIPR